MRGANAKAISMRRRSLRCFVTAGFVAVALSMSFVPPMVAGPFEDRVPKQMKQDHAILLRHPPEGHFSLWRMKNEAEAILSGYIAYGVAEKLSQFLNQTPQVRTLGLYSGGGRLSVRPVTL